MNKNTKGIIAVGITLGVVGLAYYFLVYKKDNSGGGSGDNFNSLQDNLGFPKTKLDSVTVKFNDGKNVADFFKNNRVWIYNLNKDVKSNGKAGTYSDGGKTIKLDSGKEIVSGSVFSNLLQTIK
jgi:hypothetical protein